MFDVLVFVYENYCPDDTGAQWGHLERKLNAVGFETEEIQDALTWLRGLSQAASGIRLEQPPADPAAQPAGRPAAAALQQPAPGALTASPDSMRVYSCAEQDHLGSQCLGFVSFLESTAVLSPQLREIVIDRAMAAPGNPVSVEDLKVIVLMVYWSFGEEPDALVLDELCDDTEHRKGH